MYSTILGNLTLQTLLVHRSHSNKSPLYPNHGQNVVNTFLYVCVVPNNIARDLIDGQMLGIYDVATIAKWSPLVTTIKAYISRVNTQLVLLVLVVVFGKFPFTL